MHEVTFTDHTWSGGGSVRAEARSWPFAVWMSRDEVVLYTTCCGEEPVARERPYLGRICPRCHYKVCEEGELPATSGSDAQAVLVPFFEIFQHHWAAVLSAQELEAELRERLRPALDKIEP